MRTAIQDIHEYWFGPLDAAGMARPEQHQLWFSASDATDADLRRRFGALVERALDGALHAWADDDAGLVALVLLLDQFTRNIFRGTPRAFAGDPQALALARQTVAAGRHRRLPAIHRVFLYLPLEHCEDLATQDECLRLFAELARDSGGESVAGFQRYALAHREVIAQFGRFPHRNAMLGRDSTPEELAHLASHGGF
jgi:uncharacterized protein (DUF924 family)